MENGRIFRTYAYFDLIGTKKSMRGNAEKLKTYWQALEKCPEIASTGYRARLKDGGLVTPSPVVRVFSDSALLYMNEELKQLRDFYEIVEIFLGVLRRFELAVYCIVNKDWEIPTPTQYSYTRYSSPQPDTAFSFVIGAGAAILNIFIAEELIKGHKEWHGRYFLYCIGSGKENISEDYQDLDSMPFEGFDGEEKKIFALEKTSSTRYYDHYPTD